MKKYQQYELNGVKKYFAEVCIYGLNVSYASKGWTAHMFDTKEARDAFVEKENRETTRQVVGGIAQASTKAKAFRIAGVKKNDIITVDDRDGFLAVMY